MDRPPAQGLLQHRLPAPREGLGRANRDVLVRKFDGENVVVLCELKRERLSDALDLDLQGVDPEIGLARKVREPVTQAIEIKDSVRIVNVGVTLIRNQFERMQVYLIPTPRDGEKTLRVPPRDSAIVDEIIEYAREIEHAIDAA